MATQQRNGVLRVLQDAIEAYHYTCQKIKNFRNPPGVARTAQAVLLVQRQTFVSECQYLLHLVVRYPNDAIVMTSNVDHGLWLDRNLETSLAHRLGAMYEGCDAVLGIIGALLREILEDLQWLQDLGLQSSNSGMIFHEIRRSWNVAFNKTKVKKKLDALRDRNMDLAGLRTQLKSMIHDTTSLSWHQHTSTRQKSAPREFAAIHDESQELFSVLQNGICQQRGVYNSHWAKLYVSAQIERSRAPNEQLYDALCFDLGIFHQADGGPHDRVKVDQLMLWLYVRCKALKQPPAINDRAERKSPPPQDSPDADPDSRSTRSAKRGRVGLDGLRENFAKRVRFFEPETPSSASTPYSPGFDGLTPTAEVAQSPSVSTRDWKNIRDYGTVCNFLRQNFDNLNAGHSMGFIDSQPGARHSFYSGVNRPTSHLRHHQFGHGEIINLRDLTTQSTEKSFPIADQLRIAAEVTRTMIKFAGTPWLKNDWGLADLALFGGQHTFLADADTLRTLHLTAVFAEPNPDAALRLRELETLYRIKDWALASLGAALLELGYRQSLEEYRSRIEPHTILTARRLVESCPTPLGPKYQSLVKQCFEYGAFDSVHSMQSTVYADILRGLEDMIAALSVRMPVWR